MDVRDFTDYRDFLRAHAESMKARNRSWSLGVWSRKLNLRTRSSIAKVLQGQRDLGPKLTAELIRYFQFSPDEAEYFQGLIKLTKEKKDSKVYNLLLEKLRKDRERPDFMTLRDQACTVLSRWYIPIIADMVRLKDFKEDVEEISRNLNSKVSPAEVLSAIETLIQAKILARDAQGNLKNTNWEVNATHSPELRAAYAGYYRQLIQVARDKLDEGFGPTSNFAFITVPIHSKNVTKLNAYIAEFQKRIFSLFEEEAGDAVYQVMVQVIPMTRVDPPSS